MTGMKPKRRVLIVGAKFGELYANAFLEDRAGLELAGVLARGSVRSLRLAQAFGVPFYTSMDDVPHDLDIACVVVRSTVVGGEGSFLAEALLRRGVHVIQEHPVHPDDIVRLQTLAQERGCAYWVNGFYPHTPAGRAWVGGVHRVRDQLDDPAPFFANITTSRQLLYSALDLMVQAIGTYSVDTTILSTHENMFHLVQLRVPHGEILLRLQASLDPQDPDQHSLIMHQMTVGWTSGYLSLATSYGPVLWCPVFHDPAHADPGSSLCRHHSDNEQSPFGHAPATLLHRSPKDWLEAFEVDGPCGVAAVLDALCGHLDGGGVPPAFDPVHQYEVARLWRTILHQVGPAREESLPVPLTITAESLRFNRCEQERPA